MTIFVSCSNYSSKQVTTLPEVINQDTGLREFRFRRYDCQHLPHYETNENCENNEEIVVEAPSKSSSPTDAQNVRINELTPWLTGSSRTVVNPSLSLNEAKQEMIVYGYLRMSNKAGASQDFKVTFKGDLKSYRDEYRKNPKITYLNLKKLSSETSEVVNAIVYCFDAPTCKDVTLVFSFHNFDSKGNKFIDSRPFQMDQRETEIKPTDLLPKRATRTLEEPIALNQSTESDLEEYVDDEHEDPAFAEGAVGPVLPTENKDSLCEGLVQDGEICPDYLVDSSLPKPNADINVSTKNPLVAPEEESESKDNYVETPIETTDEEIFPDEEVVLNPNQPRKEEENLDLIPTKPKFDPNLYHQFILRLRQIKEQTISNMQSLKINTNLDYQDIEDQADNQPGSPKQPANPKATDTKHYEEIIVQTPAGPKKVIRPVKVDQNNASTLNRSARPRARPLGLGLKAEREIVESQQKDDNGSTYPSFSGTQRAEERMAPSINTKKLTDSASLKSETSSLDSKPEVMSDQDLGLSKSIRPRARPTNLVERAENEDEDAVVPFYSIDGKFKYDLSKCGEHQIKAKSVDYNQARGKYNDGSLRNSKHFKGSDYETVHTDTSRAERQYSSNITQEILEFAACVLEQRYGDKLKVVLKDFSDQNGGKLGRHRSHQNGLDVDVSYPHLNGTTRGFDDFASNITTGRLEASFDYARLVLYTDRVSSLFTDRRIIKKFCSYLKNNDKLEFRNVVEGFMYHVSSHHHHYHLRVRCNSQNVGCVFQPNLGTPNACN